MHGASDSRNESDIHGVEHAFFVRYVGCIKYKVCKTCKSHNILMKPVSNKHCQFLPLPHNWIGCFAWPKSLVSPFKEII